MEIQEILEKLRPKDYELIATKLKCRYTANTVRAQLKGRRTLKQAVKKAAEELIQMRENFINA